MLETAPLVFCIRLTRLLNVRNVEHRMAHIWVLSAEPAMYDFADDAPLVIGRGSICDVRLRDARASKSHAQVRATDEGYVLEDLGSSNGTYIEGKRIRSAQLIPGIRFRIGDTNLVLDDRLLIDDADSGEGEPSSSIFHVVGLRSESDQLLPVAESTIDRTESTLETKLRLIQLVGELLVTIAKPEKLADRVLEILIKDLAADRGFLCLFDEKLNDHYPLASRGLKPGEQMRISRTLLRRMHEEESGVLVLKYGNDGHLVESLMKMSVESTMGAPLWTGDRIVGFISLDTTTTGRVFNQSHLELLMAVAMQTAVGIESSRLARKAAVEEAYRTNLCRSLSNELATKVLYKSEPTDLLAPIEREITVLCAGLAAFPDLQSKLGPIEIVKFTQDYLTSVTEAIYAFGGVIDKYLGTTIIAIFGAPIARSDFVQVAAQTALSIRALIHGMDASLGYGLRMKMGMSTGTAIVGNIGSAQRVEFTTLGKPVTIASQLLSHAQPNEICVDERTLDKIKEHFAHETLGVVEIPELNLQVKASAILSDAGSEVV